jgi:hypothetical protein
MSELPMATLRPDQKPALILDPSDDVANLHSQEGCRRDRRIVVTVKSICPKESGGDLIPFRFRTRDASSTTLPSQFGNVAGGDLISTATIE